MSAEADVTDDELLGGEQPPADETPPAGGDETPPGGEEEASRNEKLESALAELAGHVQRVTAPQPKERQFTQEEKDEYWGVYNPTKDDPDFFRKFLRLTADMEPAQVEQAIKDYLPTFSAFQKGLVRQAVIGARNLYMMDIEQLREELKPLHEYVSSERAEKTRGRFFKTYPALDDPKFERVIDGFARTLANKEYNNEGEYFKELAEGSAGLIKGLIPEFDLGAAKTTTTTKSPKLPRTTAGGGGGAGRQASSKASETGDAAGEVLDD